MADKLTLITGNAGKARELGDLLGFPLAHEKLRLTEKQALDVAEVAQDKAAQAYDQLQRPVLVDDTGLTVLAWNGLPGALIAWFLDAVGNDGILSMAASLGDRRASVTTALGYADENGPQVFTGTLWGALADQQRGSNGFGYDTIFIPEGNPKTFAELSAEQKNGISMRKLAAEKLRQQIGERFV
ncbi:non-canonical purine NTP pyrophosphatase [Geodermatophilus sp. DSM 44513]|uniref:non-canonical purine NTP pyrophosphatase n=1 Tax=Geodermatophilus sp. DSM 44513 TaxID=1528104 RepID=UPI001412A9E5|nr:non-canonical purine NTP pyrophosphatase [Geodermatophilus sp. DSM 44513]WNV76716.1 non-canonical purine NTP pyrophosphatase [Geodermatophilus sp. DSM 44513]